MCTLRDDTVGIEQSLEVQRELDGLLIGESEADAAVRGYLITAADAILTEFRSAQQATTAHLNRLSELVADDSPQQQLVDQLRVAVGTRVARLEQVILVRRTGTMELAMDAARTSDTNSARGEIRRLISEMEVQESRLLAQRRERASLAYMRAVSGRVGSGLVSAGLLIAIVLTAGLHARAKTRREAALVDSERRAREAAAAREQDARAEAERANRDKDQFLAILSHELRTPLNAVLGWTQILQTARPDAPTVERALSSIQRNAQAQQRLVEDLLDVSRIVAGKLPIERQPLNLRAAISAAVESIRPTAVVQGLTLTDDLADTPPAWGDAERIQQMAGNLLSNAVKFTPAGGHVTVRLADNGDEAVLEVTDTGSGIALELQPHIFERFRQGDASTTRTHGGLGLGLAIARHVAESHGGAIAVESRGSNAGATFRVRLPYR